MFFFFCLQWDPKITTLPGLYFLSVGMLKPISLLLSNPELCSSVYALRCINVLLSTGLLYVVYSLLKQIHGFKVGKQYLFLIYPVEIF